MREQILKLIVEKPTFIHVNYTRLSMNHEKYERGYGKLHTVHVGLPKGSINIMLTCSHLRDEAARVLYGALTIRSFNMRGFRGHFLPRVIGRFNAAHIKSITFGLPETLIESTEDLPDFLDFLCVDLKGLQCLHLTTKFMAQRGLLHTGAWVTLRHPLLKRFVWFGASGESYDYEEGDFRMDVKLVTPALKVEIMDGTHHKHRVMNSRGIRRAKWNGLVWLTSSQFDALTLPDDAETSEPVDVEQLGGSQNDKGKVQARGKGRRSTKQTIGMTIEEIGDRLDFVSSKQKKQDKGQRRLAIMAKKSWR